PVHSRNNANHQNQFVQQAVLLRNSKVNITPARPQSVPTGKPKVPAPVPTGRQNRPVPVLTSRGDSPSVTSGWWQSTARHMPHLIRPTSSYFQTYTPYVPHMYSNHMQYDGVRWATAVKPSAGCSWKTHGKGFYWENSYTDAEDEGIFDSGCSRSMTSNMERLDDFQEFQGGKVTFGGGEGRVTGKGTIRTPTLDFENVYYAKELQQFNLFSISQICDKKNRVLFIDTDCLVLSKDFKLPDESMVLLRVPRKHNLYTINLNNLSPKGNLACLVAKALVDKSVKWHRRMGHVNYKNMNRLVKGNLVRGLPPKLFKNDHTCVACCKGKQHKASYKAITAVSSISEPFINSHCDPQPAQNLNPISKSSMAALRYRDEHNKVGYLQKPKGSDDYHQILDFLGASHIRYALTNDPIIFDSLVKQFWSTATLRSPELGPPAILATIDETPYTITEESVRSQLQLADDGGIDDLPIVEIYSGMDNLGYVTEGKLTFFKNKFSPQWRFLVHTILHCLSTKSGSWDQFGSSIVVALICLSDGRRFNWSSYIFKGMVSNIGNAKKFLMYPRFLQTILGIETSITRQYHVFKLSSKLFANMKLNFVGQPMPLLDAMLSQAQEGEGAGADVQAVPPPIPETIPETRHESDHSQDHLSTSTRQQATPSSIASCHTSGGAEDHTSRGALSSVVSTLMQKVNSLETELKAHKKLFKNLVAKLVKKVKALEVTLKTKKRKVVLSDSDQEEGGDQAVDLDALIALANAAVIVDSTKSPGGASSNPAACSYDPTSDVPTDVPSGVAPTGPSTVSWSGTTTATPSSPVRDARKGKGVAVEEPTPTQDKTFKQLEEERLGWEAAQRLQAQELADLEKQRAESLMKDANLARQMSQDFEMTEDQRKRQQEVLASAANYSDAAWDIILARLQANPDLSSIIFGVEFIDDDFAARMVALSTSLTLEEKNLLSNGLKNGGIGL
ncbi:synaptobrevin, longin-like domain protein, partial [Tanacetum coccineum]